MSDNNIDVKISASTNGLNSGISEAKDQIQSLADGANNIVESFKGIGEALAGAFAFDKIDEFARSMSELGEQIERTSKMTGLSTEDVQKFQFAVQMTGGDSETAAASLLRLDRNMAYAAAGSKTAAAAFSAAGVSAKTLASSDVNAALAEIATKFQGTADGANKTALAMQLAGRGGASLVPLLDQGTAGLSAMNAELDSTNSKLTEVQVKGFAKTAEQIKEMDKATQGVADQIMTHLNPGIDGAVSGLTQLSEQFSESIKEGGAFATVIDILGEAFEGTVKFIMYAITGLEEFWDVGKGVSEAMTDVFVGFGQAMFDVVHGKIAQAWEDFKTASKNALDDFIAGVNTALDQTQKLQQSIIKMDEVAKKGIITSGGIATERKKKPQIQLPDQSGADDTKDDLAEQRSIYAEQYDVKKQTDDLMVQSGQLSHQQEFSDLQNALAKQKALTDQSFADEMAEYDDDSAEYQKLQDQKLIADEKFSIESMKLTQQETKEESKSWTDAINTIDKSFDTMLSGVLQGTQTIGQAFKNMAANMVISFAEAIAKMLIKYAAFQAATALGATQTASAIGGSEGGSGSGIMGQLVTEMLSLVGITTTQAAVTTANTAALAANTAALTASSSASGGGGLGSIFGSLFDAAKVPALDNGAVSVSEGLHYLHNDEMVVPKPFADGIRNGDISGFGSGGGGDTHLHVHALDAKSVQHFFNKNGGAVAKAMLNQVRGGSRSFLNHA